MLLIKNLTLPSSNVNFQNDNNKFCSKKLKKKWFISKNNSQKASDWMFWNSRLLFISALSASQLVTQSYWTATFDNDQTLVFLSIKWHFWMIIFDNDVVSGPALVGLAGADFLVKLFNELLSEQHLENYSIRQELFFTSFWKCGCGRSMSYFYLICCLLDADCFSFLSIWGLKMVRFGFRMWKWVEDLS